MEPTLEIIEDLFTDDESALFMKAYFDESGKHERAKTLSIFGLLMSADTCKKLQLKWLREAARHPKIPLPFHMSDCVAGRKLFAPWRDDEPARHSMQERMIRTFKGLDMQAYGASVVREDYEKIARTLRPNESLKNPWYFAFEVGIAAMMKASEQAGKAHNITFIFDRQDEFGPRALELYKELVASNLPFADRLGTLSFSPKEKIVALQAIDVIVYEINRRFEDDMGGFPERWQYRLISDILSPKVIFLDERSMQDFVDDAKERRR